MLKLNTFSKGDAMNSDDTDFLRKITDLVIEAAHKGIPEDVILEHVEDGLYIVFGPRDTKESVANDDTDKESSEDEDADYDEDDDYDDEDEDLAEE